MSTRSPECACPTSVIWDNIQKRRRKELVLFGKMLHKRHYVSGCDGNLSVRLEGGRVLTTPTGISKALLRPEHMVIVDLDGTKLDGILQPSSEIQMHLTIYRERPDVQAGSMLIPA